MRTIACGAAALALLTMPALAQDNVRSDKTVQPNELTVQAKRAPLTLDDKQSAVIRDGLVTDHTQQKTPDGFKPEVGQPLPMIMKVDVMPQDLTRREPSLKQYGYAKTATDILVLDPMKRTIIAVIPRKFPSDAKAQTPADWATRRGRESTGQAPEAADQNALPLQPAGNSGDVKNGNESNARQK